MMTSPTTLPTALPPALTAEQDAAQQQVLTFLHGPRGAFVLTGSAGTGKTTLLASLYREIAASRRSVVLLAPTGRAARVLRRRTGFPTATVHSHLYVPEPLEGRPGIRLVRKGLFAEGADVLIVDEASLVAARRSSSDAFVAPAALLDDLMGEAERTGAHLVFVGDACQLPPVGEELSVALRPDLLSEAYGLPTDAAHLAEVMRQADGSPILDAATALRDRLDGFDTDLPRLPALRWPGQAVDAYLDAVRGERYDAATMLAFMNKSVFGLNTRVREKMGLGGLLTAGDLVVTDRDGWASGRAVPRAETFVVEAVNPAPPLAGLAFADVKLRPVADDVAPVEGLALLDSLADAQGRLTHEQEMNLFAAIVQRNPEYRRTRKPSDDPFAGALRLRYGHALTVHKAQGGEWPQVFLDTFVPGSVAEETATRWKYTALTRAAETVCLVGSMPL